MREAHKRALVFCAANCAICSVLLGVTVWPVTDLFRDAEASNITRSDSLGRTIAALRDAELLIASKDKFVARDEYLTGTDGVAGAELQVRLKSFAESAQVNLKSIANTPKSISSALTLLGVRVELSGTIPALRVWLYQVENTKPFLFVSNARISLSRTNTFATDQEGPIIDAQLDVSGVLTTAVRK